MPVARWLRDRRYSAFVIDPNNDSTPFQIQEMQAAAQAVGQPLLVIDISTEEQVEKAFAAMAERNVAAIRSCPVWAIFHAAAWLEKPSDLRYPVADCNQRHPTVSTATQANTRDLAKWHVDHAAHSQPVLVELSVSRHGFFCKRRGLCRPPQRSMSYCRLAA